MAYRKDVWRFPGSNSMSINLLVIMELRARNAIKDRKQHRSRLESRTRGIKKRE